MGQPLWAPTQRDPPGTGTASDSSRPGLNSPHDWQVQKKSFINLRWNACKRPVGFHLQSICPCWQPNLNTTPSPILVRRGKRNKSNAERQTGRQTDGSDGCETSETRRSLSVLEVHEDEFVNTSMSAWKNFIFIKSDWLEKFFFFSFFEELVVLVQDFRRLLHISGATTNPLLSLL